MSLLSKCEPAIIGDKVLIIGDLSESPKQFTMLPINVLAYFGRFFLALSWIKCRKVTMHKRPCIDVLSIETKPRMGDRKN